MSESNEPEILFGVYCPPHPQPLLSPDANAGYAKLRAAFDECRRRIEESDADIILVYSTTWASIIGHQIQALENAVWTHVDDDFHYLGSMPYEFAIDTEFAHAMKENSEKRGLEARTVEYEGFPLDTGSVVALQLLNPDNRIPSCILSSNMYSNRAETIVLGKAVRDTLAQQGKKAVVVVVSSLSNRMFTEHIDPAEDRNHSQNDDDWNRTILEFFVEGRLEDLSQCCQYIHVQIRMQKLVTYKPSLVPFAQVSQDQN